MPHAAVYFTVREQFNCQSYNFAGEKTTKKYNKTRFSIKNVDILTK